MNAPNKRLALLEQMTASGKADSFTWYGLAMEYRSAGRDEDALRTFEHLRRTDPAYLPMYLMVGQLLLEQDRSGDARPWLEQGLELAQSQGNSKAASELSLALEECE